MTVRTTLKDFSLMIPTTQHHSLYTADMQYYLLRKEIFESCFPFLIFKQGCIFSHSIEVTSSLACGCFLRGTFITSFNSERSWRGGEDTCLLIILFQIASCTRTEFYYWSVAATAVERVQPDLPKLLGDEYCTWLTRKKCVFLFFF